MLKLVDFDLVDQIENLHSMIAIFNKTRIILFMLVEILELTVLPLNKKKYKDKIAFLLKLFALFKHYFKGHSIENIFSNF